MIDWEQQIASLERETVADHLFTQGNPPVTGCDAPPGYFTDLEIASAGGAACSLQAWVMDNSPFEIILDYRFEAWNSKAKITVYWKDQLDENQQKVVAKQWDWEVVRGRSSLSSNFAGQHELLGALMFKKFAEWVKSIKESES